MKKVALSLAVFGLSMGAISASFAVDPANKPVTSVFVENRTNFNVIAEALDKNCEVIVSKKVCAHEGTKLVVKCTKDFKFAACPANFGPSDYPPPYDQDCKNNPGTKYCPFNSPTFVQITSDRNGKLILDCKKRRD